MILFIFATQRLKWDNKWLKWDNKWLKWDNKWLKWDNNHYILATERLYG